MRAMLNSEELPHTRHRSCGLSLTTSHSAHNTAFCRATALRPRLSWAVPTASGPFMTRTSRDYLDCTEPLSQRFGYITIALSSILQRSSACSVHRADSELVPSPPTIESWPRVESLPLGLSGLAFEARHPMIEFLLDLAIGAGRDVAHLIGATKFLNGLLDYLSSLAGIASVMFVVNCQLLVSVVSVP